MNTVKSIWPQIQTKTQHMAAVIFIKPSPWNMEIRACIDNYILIKWWDVVAEPSPNPNGVLTKFAIEHSAPIDNHILPITMDAIILDNISYQKETAILM